MRAQILTPLLRSTIGFDRFDRLLDAAVIGIGEGEAGGQRGDGGDDKRRFGLHVGLPELVRAPS